MSLAPWESPGKHWVLDDIEKRKGNMTKQHFELIARVLREVVVHGINGDPVRGVSLSYRFADELAETNERFDRARFLKAAGLNAEEIKLYERERGL